MGRRDDWHESDIPPEFLDFSTRHGMASIHSLWGINLIFGLGALYAAVLFAITRDFGTDFFLFFGAALVMLAASGVFYLRKRKKDAQRRAAYERWRAQQENRNDDTD